MSARSALPAAVAALVSLGGTFAHVARGRWAPPIWLGAPRPPEIPIGAIPARGVTVEKLADGRRRWASRKRREKRALMREHGIATGRQWKRLKRALRRGERP